MILAAALSSAVNESFPAKRLYRCLLDVLQPEALSQAKRADHRRCERVFVHGVNCRSIQSSNMDFLCT